MSPSRQQEVERNLSGVARKVLSAVPVSEPWTAALIGKELFRIGTRVEMSVLQGCLAALKDDGLVKEPTPRTFIRIAIRTKPIIALKTITPESTMPASQKPEVTDPIQRLTELAASARVLATQIEDAALDVEELLQRSTADTEKLRQLQALLRG